MITPPVIRLRPDMTPAGPAERAYYLVAQGTWFAWAGAGYVCLPGMPAATNESAQ